MAIEKLWLNLNRDPSHRISRLFEIWVHWAHPLPSFLRWINKKFHTKQFFCSLEDIICFLFWKQHVYLACHYSKYFFNAQFFLSLAINYFCGLFFCLFFNKTSFMPDNCTFLFHVRFNYIFAHSRLLGIWKTLFLFYLHTLVTFRHIPFLRSYTATNLLALWAFSHIFVLRENFLYALHLFWEEIKQKIIIFLSHSIDICWHLEMPSRLPSIIYLTILMHMMCDKIDLHYK